MATSDEPATKRQRLEDAAPGVGPAEAARASDAPATSPAGPSTTEHVDVATLLPALQRLLAMYKVEYWTLLEELRSRRHVYCTSGRQTAADSSGTDPAGQQLEATIAAAEASKGSMQALMQAMADTAGAPAADDDVQLVAEHKAPAGKGLQDHDQQAEEAEPDHQQQQQPYGDERCGHGGSHEQPPPPRLAEAERVLLQLLPGSDQGAASPQQLAAWHERFKAAADAMAGLEQLASAATLQYLDAQGGLACLCGSAGRWVLRRTAVSLGRSTDSKGDVDVDLGKAGEATNVSRLQAQLTLGCDGCWTLCNTGRALLLVNGNRVPRGEVVLLPHLSLVEVGDTALLFMVNSVAVQRAVARTKHLVM